MNRVLILKLINKLIIINYNTNRHRPINIIIGVYHYYYYTIIYNRPNTIIIINYN